MERLNKCPLCKSGLFLNHLEIKDYAVSSENFIICKCTACDLLFTNPRPKINKIGPYYDFPEYYSHADQSKTITQFAYNRVRKIAINSKVKLLSNLKPEKGRLLDYGCGTAELLHHAEASGWKVAGIEPSPKAQAQALQKLPSKIFPNLDELSDKKSFDIITMFHVLEHIHDLRKTIKKLVKLLKSGGYIIIAVPNYESKDAKKYKEYWAGWDLPRHLYHFNQKAMQSFKNEFNLDLKEVKPMPFDSYYVSLLSEGYRKPKRLALTKYWNAIWTGFQSNKSANTTEANYSSNLYIFSKK